MSQYFRKWGAIYLGISLLFNVLNQSGLNQAFCSPILSLSDYINQVKTRNQGIQGSLTAGLASELRSEEGRLLLSPYLYANVSLLSDSKIPPSRFVIFDQQITQNYSIGVSQLTKFGLEAKLHYDLFAQYYTHPSSSFNFPGLGSSSLANFDSGLFAYNYALASPVLELTQSLWGNGFGRSTRANQELQESNALASSYSSLFEAKSTLSQAEINYWNLAVARQSVRVQEEALDRAKKIYAYNKRKLKLNLGEASDVLQAEALVQSRELELASAKNEVRRASRAFNGSRFIDSDNVLEEVVQLHPSFLDHIEIPSRAAQREDVKAAAQIARSQAASATLSAEKDLPTLEVFGSVALNGQQDSNFTTHLSDSISYSFSLNRPTESIGLRFRMPLNQSLVAKSRDGWSKQSIAAEKTFDQKVFDTEQSWKNLNESLSESKSHLALSRKLEEVQKKKLEAERERLSRGRTTTYQVLLFEQDYLLSQLNRIRDQNQVLTIISQMKLFGETI